MIYFTYLEVSHISISLRKRESRWISEPIKFHNKLADSKWQMTSDILNRRNAITDVASSTECHICNFFDFFLDSRRLWTNDQYFQKCIYTLRNVGFYLPNVTSTTPKTAATKQRQPSTFESVNSVYWPKLTRCFSTALYTPLVQSWAE